MSLKSVLPALGLGIAGLLFPCYLHAGECAYVQYVTGSVEKPPVAGLDIQIGCSDLNEVPENSTEPALVVHVRGKFTPGDRSLIVNNEMVPLDLKQKPPLVFDLPIKLPQGVLSKVVQIVAVSVDGKVARSDVRVAVPEPYVPRVKRSKYFLPARVQLSGNFLFQTTSLFSVSGGIFYAPLIRKLVPRTEFEPRLGLQFVKKYSGLSMPPFHVQGGLDVTFVTWQGLKVGPSILCDLALETIPVSAALGLGGTIRYTPVPRETGILKFFDSFQLRYMALFTATYITHQFDLGITLDFLPSWRARL